MTMLELCKCDVDIACLSEVRIPDSGHSVIKVPGEQACYHLYHSNVAIAFREAAQAALLAWVPISPRLASERLIKTYYASTKMKVRASEWE